MHPFLAGVLFILGLEFVLLIIAATITGNKK